MGFYDEPQKPVAPPEDPSVLESLFTFLGRPGASARSLLRGEVGDAFENSAMFGSDLLSFGWLTEPTLGASVNPLRWGPLARAIGQDDTPHGITSREERPEFSNVLESWGASAPEEGSWGRLGVDIAGGILTDPLTYLTGGAGAVAKGGLSAAGGLARGATVAARASRGLAQTRLGREALARFGDDGEKAIKALLWEQDEVRKGFSQRVAAQTNHFLNDDALKAEAQRYADMAGRAAQAAGTAGDDLVRHQKAAYDTTIQHLAKQRAMDSLGAAEQGGQHVLARLPNYDALDEVLEAGRNALVRKGYLLDPGTLYAKIPFFDHYAQVMPGFYSWVGKGLVESPFSLIGGARGLLKLASPEVAALADEVARGAWEGTKGIYSRAAVGTVPEWARARAHLKEADQARRVTEWVEKTRMAFTAAGAELDEARPLRQFVMQEWAKKAEDFLPLLSPASPNELLSNLRGLAARLHPETAQAVGQLAPKLGEASSLMFGIARDDLMRAAEAAGFNGSLAGKSIDAFVGLMADMPDDLIRTGVWKEQRRFKNPFYVPHQATETLAAFLSQSKLPTKKVASGRAPYAEALYEAAGDVFTQGRKFNLDELVEKLSEVARKYDVDLPDLEDVGLIGQVLETDLLDLAIKRGVAHAGTITRAEYVNDMAKFAKSASLPAAEAVRYGNAIDDYVAAQLAPLGPRTNAFQKILAGGTFRSDGGAGEKLGYAAARVLGGAEQAIGKTRTGDPVKLIHFAGLNAIYKPLMTVGAPPNPSFFGRNLLTGAVMASLDRDLGPAAAYSLFKQSVRDVPALSFLRKWLSPSDSGKILKAAQHGWDSIDPADADRLRRAAFSGMTGEQYVNVARSGVVQSSAYTDMEVLGAFHDVGAVAQIADEGVIQALKRVWGGEAISKHGRLVESLRAVVRPGVRINDALEGTMRSAALNKLLERGFSPAEAQERIAKLFVDYSYQSGLERWIRDLVPFARYAIGSTPVVLESLATAPGRGVNAVARHLVTSASAGQAVLPPGVTGQTSIPLGTDEFGQRQYLTNLGLPYEPAANVLGMIGPTGLRQQLLGATNPLLRAAGEQVVGSQFYSGRPIGENTRAPWVLSPVAEKYQTPTGAIVKEVPPFVNHWLLGAMPWTRFVSELDKWFDGNPSSVARVLNLATGVKVRTIDEEREVRRAIERYLEKQAAAGEIGKIETFFVKKGKEGELDPELAQALKQLQALRRK